jgi:hypothetical protein
MNTLRLKIMRGIYYAYLLRLLSLPGVIQGFLMVAIMIALTRFVSIGHVLKNLAGVELGRLGTYLVDSARTTEVWTLVLLGLLTLCLLSVRSSMFSRLTSQSYTYARG